MQRVNDVTNGMHFQSNEYAMWVSAVSGQSNSTEQKRCSGVPVVPIAYQGRYLLSTRHIHASVEA